jgi:hypothetical protein
MEGRADPLALVNGTGYRAASTRYGGFHNRLRSAFSEAVVALGPVPCATLGRAKPDNGAA